MFSTHSWSRQAEAHVKGFGCVLALSVLLFWKRRFRQILSIISSTTLLYLASPMFIMKEEWNKKNIPKRSLTRHAANRFFKCWWEIFKDYLHGELPFNKAVCWKLESDRPENARFLIADQTLRLPQLRTLVEHFIVNSILSLLRIYSLLLCLFPTLYNIYILFYEYLVLTLFILLTLELSILLSC